ncbi:MAG: histidinol-phosphate transaminase [SAR202 cluster bacterium Casp-Chloro-G4]|nr:histidinol-phosphate transaminase [Chloroflexota bacterium]MDA1228629.1 histidinol-phosphate transaminase [Chloroflexota bacterium]PKB61987.1 MAG: histidinol-phosphate transaminase [SAR202 cluster bacterium Casp-Chloro-G4]
MVDIDKFIRPHLAKVQTYDPVDPPELLAKQAGIPEDQIVKLNGNENPYGGSPKAIAAVANTPLHIYPDPLQRKIRQALSDYTGASFDSIIVGAGADELIDLLFRLFMNPGDKMLDFEPTFGMYSFCARIAGGVVEFVPRDELFDLDVEAAKRAIDDRTKIIFVTSPNNPTGNLASEANVRELLDTGLIVVVDEAYFEFCNQTVSHLVDEYENLVILRTMSKWAGLAGLRVGYGIMNPKLVKHIIDIKPPYSVNVAAEAALVASIEDAPALLKNVRKIVDERDRLKDLLNEMPGVTPWPSYGNYILCQFAPGKAQEIFKQLASRGIFVRDYSSQRLKDCFRVAIGTPAETDAFISALREVV